MNDGDKDLLFEAVDPRGYPVVLTTTRYYEHIISSDDNHQAHPEFTPDEIKQTIENPVVIYASNRPNSDVYFGKSCSQYPKMFLKVAVDTYSDCGNVSTAFITPHIRGGIVEEGGLKYANYKSGL